MVLAKLPSLCSVSPAMMMVLSRWVAGVAAIMASLKTPPTNPLQPLWQVMVSITQALQSEATQCLKIAWQSIRTCCVITAISILLRGKCDSMGPRLD